MALSDVGQPSTLPGQGVDELIGELMNRLSKAGNHGEEIRLLMELVYLENTRKLKQGDGC